MKFFKPLKFGDNESYGIIENLIASMIFFAPNFLLFFDFFSERLYIFLLYDFFIIFLITSAMSHYKFFNGVKR